ncbi:hypothetical protein BGLA2_420169 [Burkholderia gladioli]|nr:hypothetical protein BGLA2_420169 [Burkholderia gladioli]
MAQGGRRAGGGNRQRASQRRGGLRRPGPDLAADQRRRRLRVPDPRRRPAARGLNLALVPRPGTAARGTSRTARASLPPYRGPLGSIAKMRHAANPPPRTTRNSKHRCNSTGSISAPSSRSPTSSG